MIPHLKVRDAGMHTTLQDLGRLGFQSMGVPVSGALDNVSLIVANRLAGNHDNSAALEILYHGVTLEVCADSARVALGGSNVPLQILGDDQATPTIEIPSWRSVLVRRGQVFRVGALKDSVCCYLAVEGGFDLPPCLDSLSTYVRGGFGGLGGRALRAGDALPLVLANASNRGDHCLPKPPELGTQQPIRVVLGPQQDYFTAEALEVFLTSVYTVSTHADRMGMRLDGPRLQHRGSYNIVSDAIVTGAIQVPGSGQPIVLLADHQTTGGYPKIATVISTDLPRIGRLRPGNTLKFTAIEVERAETIRRQQAGELNALVAQFRPVPDVKPNLQPQNSR
jgi:biotin-dependent carboxylase-like uncharacterized protein